MSYYAAIQLCNERYREGLGGAECVDDELLGVIADLQGRKRGDCYLGYRAHIGIGLAPDNDLSIHVLPVPPPSWNPTIDFSRSALRRMRERLVTRLRDSLYRDHSDSNGLETSGLIIGYRAQLDALRLGLTLMALVHISMAHHTPKRFESLDAAVRAQLEVLACLLITGREGNS